MTDLEWARAFVDCKLEGTGRRFNETVDVLAKKLAQAREEGAGQRGAAEKAVEPPRLFAQGGPHHAASAGAPEGRQDAGATTR